MDKVCPLCNALQPVAMHCPQCGELLMDGGAVENYVGPYSPYIESEVEFEEDGMYCIHLLYCPRCDYDTREACKMIYI